MGREKHLIVINAVLAFIVFVSIYSGLNPNPDLSDSVGSASPSQSHPQQTAAWTNPLPPKNSVSTQQDTHKTKTNDPALWQGRNCNQSCQLRILDHLQSGQILSNRDVKLITQNADIFAPQIAKEPDLLIRLLSTLNDEDDDKIALQPAALAVRAALSDTDRKRVGTRLINSSDPSARIIGLDVIGYASAGDIEASTLFSDFMSTETNPRVLVKAIHVIGDQDIGTHSRVAILNTIMNAQHSDFIAGTALVAKVKLMPSEYQTRREVNRALSSPSLKMQRYGLQALAVLQSSKGAPQSGQTDEHSLEQTQLFEDALTNIADDPNVDNDTRLLALELMRDT